MMYLQPDSTLLDVNKMDVDQHGNLVHTKVDPCSLPRSQSVTRGTVRTDEPSILYSTHSVPPT